MIFNKDNVYFSNSEEWFDFQNIYTKIRNILLFLCFSNNKILEKKNSKSWVIASIELIVMELLTVRGNRAIDYTYSWVYSRESLW